MPGGQPQSHKLSWALKELKKKERSGGSGGADGEKNASGAGGISALDVDRPAPHLTMDGKESTLVEITNLPIDLTEDEKVDIINKEKGVTKKPKLPNLLAPENEALLRDLLQIIQAAKANRCVKHMSKNATISSIWQPIMDEFYDPPDGPARGCAKPDGEHAARTFKEKCWSVMKSLANFAKQKKEEDCSPCEVSALFMWNEQQEPVNKDKETKSEAMALQKERAAANASCEAKPKLEPPPPFTKKRPVPSVAVNPSERPDGKVPGEPRSKDRVLDLEKTQDKADEVLSGIEAFFHPRKRLENSTSARRGSFSLIQWRLWQQ